MKTSICNTAGSSRQALTAEHSAGGSRKFNDAGNLCSKVHRIQLVEPLIIKYFQNYKFNH